MKLLLRISSPIPPEVIPFEDLDKEMVDIIKLLNCEYGYKTKYCCFGHGKKANLYIMFHEDMNNQIEDLAIRIAEHIKGTDFSFKFWIRDVRGKVEKNWLCETNGAKSESDRFRILNELADVITDCFKKKGDVIHL